MSPAQPRRGTGLGSRRPSRTGCGTNAAPPLLCVPIPTARLGYDGSRSNHCALCIPLDHRPSPIRRHALPWWWGGSGGFIGPRKRMHGLWLVCVNGPAMGRAFAWSTWGWATAGHAWALKPPRRHIACLGQVVAIHQREIGHALVQGEARCCHRLECGLQDVNGVDLLHGRDGPACQCTDRGARRWALSVLTSRAAGGSHAGSCSKARITGNKDALMRQCPHGMHACIAHGMQAPNRANSLSPLVSFPPTHARTQRLTLPIQSRGALSAGHRVLPAAPLTSSCCRLCQGC